MKTVLRLLLVPLLAASLTSCGDSSSGTHPTELSSLRSRFRPRNALRLPPDAVAHATRAALKKAPKVWGVRYSRKAIMTNAARAPFDSERSDYVKRQCGRRVWRRTVVVYLLLPKFLPSASLSQGILLVSHLRKGWTVWDRVH